MKYRLDQLLVTRNYYPSREKAKAHILSGHVLVNNQVVTKVGILVSEEAEIRVKEQDRYVSRGGLKLEKALNDFQLSVADLVVLDIGASTGGFTDCLIQHGAKLVYSTDVGFNQIDYRFRNHPKVRVFENLNAKDLNINLFDKDIQLAVIDVSFISLTKILNAVLSVLSEKHVLALVKPQFEVGLSIQKFNGVVKQFDHHLKALYQVNDFANKLGIYPKFATHSPIKGPKGNIEFFIYWTDEIRKPDIDFNFVVQKAHEELN